jgi:hypothetical protein
MAALRGYGQATYIQPQDGAIGVGGPAVANSNPGLAIIDGTPIRVCVLALAAAAGLTALKLAGFRFNVGVSS